MTGKFTLDWITLSISLFNTIMILWLGFTVLFNAERRSLGVILAVAGLLAGAGFFISHSAILALGASSLIRGFSFWWQMGWLPVIAAPYAWYLLMLWYTGYWDLPENNLRRRQRAWLGLSVAYTLGLAVLLLVANPLPSISYNASIQIERLPSLGELPLIILAYPPYILLCLALALDALLRPAPSQRVMGDLARRRARPWLVGASVMLLVVSLLVGAVFFWLVQVARQERVIALMINSTATTLSLIDLALAMILMFAVLLLGQAIVSYEIFSGKTLPRRGFQNQWRRLLALAAALSMLSAASITAHLPQVYTSLAILTLVTAAFALSSRQSFVDRENSIHQLRPFVASQRLYERMLTPPSAAQPEIDLAAPFGALCQEVLNTRQAILLPLGSLAALGIAPLHFPPGSSGELPVDPELLTHFTSPQMTGLPLDPQNQSGMVWAAPLWSERGLIGVLYFGPKNDGGVYSQEEIEVARSSGERLVDVLASAEMARRLIVLQRKRLIESGILDRRARASLHDEILPRLHTALLQLSSLPEAGLSIGRAEILVQLTQVHRQISNLLHDLPKNPIPQLVRLGLAEALRRVIVDELPNSFDDVVWDVDPLAEQYARSLPDLSAEVVYYAAREAVRNAARHARTGREPKRLCLKIVMAWSQGLKVMVEDNGVGLPSQWPAAGLPGSPDPADEGGQGLALHSTMMAVINGSLALESAPGQYTRLTLFVPETALS